MSPFQHSRFRLPEGNSGAGYAWGVVAGIDASRVRLARSLRSYRADRVQLETYNLAGWTHVVATRKGLFLVSPKLTASPARWRVLLYGQFFGITFWQGDLLVFEACGSTESDAPTGRIVRLRRTGEHITGADVLVKGLDTGCHQTDVIHGRLCVVDTYRQRVVSLAPDGSDRQEILPLITTGDGRFDRNNPQFLHANSLLAIGQTTFLLLHQRWVQTGRHSEVALFGPAWEPRGRLPLSGRGCHDLALLEDGTLLVCDSFAGDLIGTGGLRVNVTPLMSRGLAVGADGLAVGGSYPATRGGRRLSSAGTVTFLDRAYRVQSVLELPGAPTVIRRLDGCDHGLSAYLETVPCYLETVPWGAVLRPGAL